MKTIKVNNWLDARNRANNVAGSSGRVVGCREGFIVIPKAGKAIAIEVVSNHHHHNLSSK